MLDPMIIVVLGAILVGLGVLLGYAQSTAIRNAGAAVFILGALGAGGGVLWGIADAAWHVLLAL